MGDIVVDQFEIGCIGGIAAEAMSFGKPVLTYIEPFFEKALYHNDPLPLYKAQSKEEIYEQIIKIARDPQELSKVGIKCKEWIYRNHGAREVFLELFLKLDSGYQTHFLASLKIYKQ